MGEHAGAANEDAAIDRRLHIDRGVARPGGDEELELRQALEQRPRERGALAHGDEDLIILELRRGGVDAAQRRVEHIDRDLGFQARPIRHGERDILIIVEYGEPLHAIAPLSAAWTLTGHGYGFVYRQSSAAESGRASPATAGETAGRLSRQLARPGRRKNDLRALWGQGKTGGLELWLFRIRQKASRPRPCDARCRDFPFRRRHGR